MHIFIKVSKRLYFLLLVQLRKVEHMELKSPTWLWGSSEAFWSLSRSVTLYQEVIYTREIQMGWGWFRGWKDVTKLASWWHQLHWSPSNRVAFEMSSVTSGVLVHIGLGCPMPDLMVVLTRDKARRELCGPHLVGLYLSPCSLWIHLKWFQAIIELGLEGKCYYFGIPVCHPWTLE